ncbi:MAG: DUF2066 domain-containing protein [Kiloniellales bacterium]|nr:DUF2066 domain-containing protein [Kiloniellales bacterium]
MLTRAKTQTAIEEPVPTTQAWREVALRRWLSLLLLLIPAGDGPGAAEVADLYRAETVVTGTLEPERSRGFRAGLTDVVVKLTGDARLAGDDRLAPLVERAHSFVASFDYEDRMKGIPVHDEQGTRERPHLLRMRFKAAELDRALGRLGLSIWPAERPLLAVWLGIETAGDRYVLRAAGARGYGQRAVLVETAARRGLPLLLPEAASGESAVAFEDIAAEDVSRMIGESPGADALLAGVLSLAEGGYWDITWRLTWRARSRAWRLRGVSFDTALRDGLQTSALVLSGRAPP